MITNSIVEPQILKTLNEYFRQVDSLLPGLIEGFYLVGSIALNDYIPGVSDIDFVAVTSSELTNHELEFLTKVHKSLAKTKEISKVDGIYTTWSALTRSTSQVTVHHWLDTVMERNSSYGANPVTWETILKHPVIIRGNPKPEVYHSDIELREWCKVNLVTYWAHWIQRSRKIGFRFIASFHKDSICWGVLGVVRLHATITTGEIISKSQTLEYGRKAFPDHWNSILENAYSGRRSSINYPRLNPFSRRPKALSFMEYVIADVN